MPLDAVRVGLAVQSGLSVVCATCRRYWEGRERGLPGSRCTSESGCGSPLAGDDFRDYEGPIRDFTRWCFMCGTEAPLVLQIPRSERLFGVCSEHVEVLSQLRPHRMLDAQAVEQRERLLLKAAGGEARPLYRLFQKRRPTLREMMLETEREWAEQAKARGEE